jgi:phosphatidylserine decarboxylase
MKIDPDGIKLFGLFFGLAIICWGGYHFFDLISLRWLGGFFLLLMFFALSFFRDPDRVVPQGEGYAISSADGKVIDVGIIKAEGFGESGALRIAVFMNVFNVHVNRSPVDGKVVAVKHFKGKKLSAYNRSAEYENEHGDTDIETGNGLVRVRQIAGLIARRVVTRVEKNEELKKGDRIGIIRFGSRVDVLLPVGYYPRIKPGDWVRAGETVIAIYPLNHNVIHEK